jgi:hypothetical protein
VAESSQRSASHSLHPSGSAARPLAPPVTSDTRRASSATSPPARLPSHKTLAPPSPHTQKLRCVSALKMPSARARPDRAALLTEADDLIAVVTLLLRLGLLLGQHVHLLLRLHVCLHLRGTRTSLSRSSRCRARPVSPRGSLRAAAPASKQPRQGRAARSGAGPLPNTMPRQPWPWPASVAPSAQRRCSAKQPAQPGPHAPRTSWRGPPPAWTTWPPPTRGHCRWSRRAARSSARRAVSPHQPSCWCMKTTCCSTSAKTGTSRAFFFLTFAVGGADIAKVA